MRKKEAYIDALDVAVPIDEVRQEFNNLTDDSIPAPGEDYMSKESLQIVFDYVENRYTCKSASIFIKWFSTDMTWQEIAKLHHVCPERCRQIIDKIVKHLRRDILIAGGTRDGNLDILTKYDQTKTQKESETHFTFSLQKQIEREKENGKMREKYPLSDNTMPPKENRAKRKYTQSRPPSPAPNSSQSNINNEKPLSHSASTDRTSRASTDDELGCSCGCLCLIVFLAFLVCAHFVGEVLFPNAFPRRATSKYPASMIELTALDDTQKLMRSAVPLRVNSQGQEHIVELWSIESIVVEPDGDLSLKEPKFKDQVLVEIYLKNQTKLNGKTSRWLFSSTRIWATRANLLSIRHISSLSKDPEKEISISILHPSKEYIR